jgi:hypothetical protein
MTASSKLPPPGFYTDPKNPELERWWDGAIWAEITRKPENPAAGGADKLLGGALGNLPEQAKGFYNQHESGVQQAAGGALIADGVIGVTGGGKSGLFEGLINLFTGTVGIILGIIFMVQAAHSTYGDVQNPTPATATISAVDKSTPEGQTAPICSVKVSFTTSTGKNISASLNDQPTRICEKGVGGVVYVMYDSDYPQSVRETDSSDGRSIPLFPLIFLLAGTVSLLRGIWMTMLRSGEIGAGVALIANARAKDTAKLAKKK